MNMRLGIGLGLSSRGAAGSASASAAMLMLAGESDGLALDFSATSAGTGSAAVKDTGTPANDFDGAPQDLLTYSGSSAKWVWNAAGVLVNSSPGTLPIDHDPTTGARLGLLVEEQRTNRCLHASDLMNAAWTKSGITATKDQTGPDGTANSASRIEATGANGTVMQAITSSSVARTFSVFLKRITGTGTVDLTLDNGTAWTDKSGDINSETFTRVSITDTLADPTVGIRLGTSGDAVAVYVCQEESGAFATSPIPTTSAAVTRAADTVSLATSAFPYSAAAGTLYAESETLHEHSAAGNLVEASSSHRNRIAQYVGPNYFGLIVTDANTNQAVLAPAVVNELAFHQNRSAYAADDFACSLDGGAVSTDASGTIPSTIDTLWLGRQSINYLDGHIKRVVYVPRRVSNADLPTWQEAA